MGNEVIQSQRVSGALRGQELPLSQGRFPAADFSPLEEVVLGRLPLDRSHLARTLEYQRLVEVRRALRHGFDEGNGHKTTPFVFRLAHGVNIPAESQGLEGFLFTERQVAERHGAEASAKLLPHYLRHVKALLGRLSGSQEFIAKLDLVSDSSTSESERYERFIGLVRDYGEQLRNEVKQLDHSRWSHQARVYHVFTRAFDLQGLRIARGQPMAEAGPLLSMLADDDLASMRARSFDTLRLMGTYPIGSVNAKGTGGGSPFSVKRYEIDPALGTTEDMRALVRRGERHGVRMMFELVLNHTAVDADLVALNPRLFIHRRTPPTNPEGYFHYRSARDGDFWIRHGGYFSAHTGRVEFWSDTLQLDYSNPDTRDIVIAQVKDIVRTFGVQSFRIDCAYQLLNRYFSQNWRNEMQNPPTEREFLDRLITEIKTEFPAVAFVAEAYDGWDELSECGFDLIYGLNDMVRAGGHLHRGWSDALASRDPGRIREAIQRAEFLHWQQGGADLLVFFGQNDQPAPWRVLEEWKWGAAVLTLMKPGALSLYAGTEAEFEAPCDEDKKMITFNRAVSIDWRGMQGDFGQHIEKLLKLYAGLQSRWGEISFGLLRPGQDNQGWVGYVLYPTDEAIGAERVLVVANPTSVEVVAEIEAPSHGVPKCSVTPSTMRPEFF